MVAAELTDVGLFGSMPRYGDLCIHASVDLKRTFSREELERAVEATIQDFPVLGRRYETRFWRDRWVPVEGPSSHAVHVLDDVRTPESCEEEMLAWVRRPIESTRERPLRVVSMRRPSGSRLLVSIMHLAVDGAGAAAVAHVFGSHLYGVRPSLPVDRRRDVRTSLERVRWYHLPVLARDIATLLLQPLRVFAGGKRERPYPSDASTGATFRHLVIPAATLDRLRARCGVGTSVNDLLVTALVRVAARRSSRGPVPVLYTMDLRRYASAPRLTAANTSSILTVIVPREAIGDLATTARAVCAITAGHRRGLAGPAFMLAPNVLGMGAPHAAIRSVVRAIHPLVVDAPLARGLLVTNVGKLDDGLRAFGDDIEDVRVIGPNIQGVDIPAVVAFGFRGRLHVELFGGPGIGALALDELERELHDALELAAE